MGQHQIHSALPDEDAHPPRAAFRLEHPPQTADALHPSPRIKGGRNGVGRRRFGGGWHKVKGQQKRPHDQHDLNPTEPEPQPAAPHGHQNEEQKHG